MLAYDKKQIGRIHRILIPAVIFTAAVLLGRMNTIMADFGQSEPLAAGKALSFAFESLTTGNALLVAPVICAFPYGAACIDEVKSGMFKNVLYRTDKASYIHSKAAACMLSGAVTLMGAALLVILISAVLLMPLETASGTANAAQAADIADTAGAAGEIAQSYEIQQLIGLVFRYGCFGAVWSLVGMLLSLWTFNRMMAWIGPFIVDYLLEIVYERYFDALKLLYPKEWLVMSWSWPLKDWGICLWLLLLAGMIALIVRRTGMRCLERVV